MSDREDESGIETIRTKIPSIRLTTSLLEDLVEIIDREYRDIKKENESASITYTIEEKDGELQKENSTNFLRHAISPDLRSIYIRLYSKDLKISVKIYLRLPWPYSYTEVEGSDSRYVEGISAQLTRVFNNRKYKTHNDFFHSKKSLIISVPIGFAVGMLYSMAIDDPSGKAINLIIWPIVIPFNFHFWFFPTLYPKVETEYSRTVKFRKLILSVLGGLAITVTGSYIFLYLPH
jgi:hypothetical protein